jgi:hypothetical protein
VLLKKKKTNAGKNAGKKKPLPTVGGKCKLVQPLWKSVWRFHKKLKIELPYAPPILLLGIYT